MNPIELFKEELQDEQLAVRINAVHKLEVIATLLTAQVLKTQLVPYLRNLIKQQDDEVVFAIAQQLPILANMLGMGHQNVVFPLLEDLCAHNQTVVRDKAVESLSTISQALTHSELNNILVPMVIRLSEIQNQPTGLLSAAQLIPNLYPIAGPKQEQLRTKFLEICQQDIIILQRATTAKIPALAEVYEKNYIISDLLKVLKERCTHKNDQIRVLAAESLKTVVKYLSKEENKTYAMPLILKASQDSSWRVRLSLAKDFAEISQAFGKDNTSINLIQVFGQLLKDVEIDVIIQAVEVFSSFLQVVSQDKISILIHQIVALGKDKHSIVRFYAVNAISAAIRHTTKEQAYQAIHPLVKELLSDESQQVRKGAILAACKFIQAMGSDSLPSLYPSLRQCITDSKWRVRLDLLTSICDLVLKMHDSEVFVKFLEPLYSFFLNDRAAAVRKLAVQRLPQMLHIYGKGEAFQVFFEKITKIVAGDASYHYKITCIYALKTICLGQGFQKYFEKCIKPLIASSDLQVPNIRQACAKCFAEILPKCPQKEAKELILEKLAVLSKDEDSGVRNTAQEVLSRF